jgi:hypothetical protein
MVRIFMRYGMVGLLAQINPALCCATPLGLMFWSMGTQGRRSCLAPTLGFVVERRWRSSLMPDSSERRWRSMRPGFLTVAAGVILGVVVECPRCSMPARTGVANANGVRTAKGRVGELASLPCLLRPMNNNPNGVAPRAGANAGLRTPATLPPARTPFSHPAPSSLPACAIPTGLWFCFGQTQGGARVARATLVFHNASSNKVGLEYFPFK